MCGFTGLVKKDSIFPLKKHFLEAHQIIQHRGPDGEGLCLFNTNRAEPIFLTTTSNKLGSDSDWKQSDIAFGHQRLAIIDLTETGSQPMFSDDRNLSIIYNGEIYNYREIKEDLISRGHHFRSTSDTEVILHAYQEWGNACVEKFNGMWAFAIQDSRKRRIFCSRDRFGIKPLYYFHDQEHFIFGSEIKQLLCFPFVKRKADQISIANYLISGTSDIFDRTFFSEIKRLSQGCNLIYSLDENKLYIEKYYDPQLIIDNHINKKKAAEQFKYLLTDSIRLRLRSDVKVGSCLSGGLDSSSIVCLMSTLLKEEDQNEIQHSFSSHFEEEEANELVYMKEAIKHSGVKPFFIYPTGKQLKNDLTKMVWHQDEPFGSTSIFAQWSVFKLVNKHSIKVMLDGQGADEMMAGYLGLTYEYFRELKTKKKYFNLLWEAYRFYVFHPRERNTIINHFFNYPLLNKINFPFQKAKIDYRPTYSDLLSTINPSLLSLWKSYEPGHKSINVFDEKETLNNLLYRLTFFSNLQSLLRYEDRNSMAFSVESRVPFLDHRLIEFVFSLPSNQKIRGGYTKRVLRDGMRNVLPEMIRKRKGKLGFATPENKWKDEILSPQIQEAIRSDILSDFVNLSKAEEYLHADEQNNKVDFTPWRWLNLYLWIKEFKIES